MVKKYGLNQFVGQLIGMVSLLMVICVSIVISYYYTNNQVLANYTIVKNEENERNSLIRVQMLVNLSRQAEKSFYAEQNSEDAQRVSHYLEQALIELADMEHEETVSPSENEQQAIPVIKTGIEQYRDTFSQSIKLWRIRGFSREEGVSLELRRAAYDGLRSRLAQYNTHGLQSIMDRIRWQEYEFYVYWSPRYIDSVQRLIAEFRTTLKHSKLNKTLSTQLTKEIDHYERELQQLATKKKGTSHERLEKHAKRIGTILKAHTIRDYNYLLRTLLYYEMEYRELGRQAKHVAGVNRTLEQLQETIQTSSISPEEMKMLFLALHSYGKSFNQLVQLDKEIATLMIKATETLKQLNLLIKDAVSQEEKVIETIRQKTHKDNLLHSNINIGVTLAMILLAMVLVTSMVRRLDRKVGGIGEALAQISQGDLDVKILIPKELQRDELDLIAYNVGVVALSLKETMARLHKRNGELEAVSKKLAKYLSPQVYTSIFSGKQEVRIQSGRKKLTIFFSDIVGFTSTTDRMESEELTNLLNAYLNEMSIIALTYGGTIDKFIGDAIMVFFGDPDSRGEQEDALACVGMAIEMRNRLVELRRIWRDEQGFTHPFRIRIGITTGFCTVGNFGSDNRMDYTIIGSNVNLASRLEHLAEPDTILISDETYLLVKERIICTPLEKIQIKGIAHPVSTYRVENFNDQLTDSELHLEAAGEGYTIQVDGEQLDTEARTKLAAQLEEMAVKLRK